MPTIPLYSSAAHPDASHQVRSPGGYEGWYFDAEDARQDLQIVAILAVGASFHPGYLRRYFRYLRAPTRHLPPLPEQFPSAYFAVYRGGRLLQQFLSQCEPGALVAPASEPKVNLGFNRFLGGDRLTIGLSGASREGQKLEGDFGFAPKLKSEPRESIFLSRQFTGGAEHRWVVANPLCDVRGVIRCAGETIQFNGLGYHDHSFGTAPVGPGVKRWLRGRVLFEDSACAFHFARPLDRGLPEEVHFIEADSGGMREIPVAVSADWSARTGWLQRYPQSVSFEDLLRLSNPRMIDSTAYSLRMIYDATYRGRDGKALCEVASPNRLRAPLLGRLIEMSTEKRWCL